MPELKETKVIDMTQEEIELFTNDMFLTARKNLIIAGALLYLGDHPDDPIVREGLFEIGIKLGDRYASEIKRKENGYERI